MARLPTPGGDNGNWGTILNDYLSRSHNANGSLKDNSVGSAQLQDNAVAAAQIVDGSITEALLSGDVQTKLNETADWDTLSNKPAVIAAGVDQAAVRTAIGLSNVNNTSDMDKPISTAVQTALEGKLDTAFSDAFSTANYAQGPGGDDRARVQAAVDDAVTELLSTSTSQTVIIHASMNFLTGSSLVGPVSTQDPNNYTASHCGVQLPVNLPAVLNIVFAHGAQITLSSDCYNAFVIKNIADHDVFQNVNFYDAWVDGGGLGIVGGRHALIGNNPRPNTLQRYLSFQDINFFGHTKLRNFYNNPATEDATDPNAVRGQTGIYFGGNHNSALEATHTFTKNIYLEYGDQEGGAGLFSAMALSSASGGCNHYHDGIIVDRWRFINPDVPIAWHSETGVFIGGAGYGDYAYIGPGYCENIGDDAIEVGGMQRLEIVSPSIKNPYLCGILLRQSHAEIDSDTQRITIKNLQCDVTSGAVDEFASPIALYVDDQVIDITSTASGGTFTLTVPRKGTTSPLNWNATASEIAAALVAVGCTASTATGGPLGTAAVTARIARVNLRSGVTANTGSLTGGTLGIALNSATAAFGTITVEDMTVRIDGRGGAAPYTDNLVIDGLDQPIRRIEVIRPNVTLSNYTFNSTGIADGSFYHPAAPYPGWGTFILRDAYHKFLACNFTDVSSHIVQFAEVDVEGSGTVVDIDGMMSDRAGTNGSGLCMMVALGRYQSTATGLQVSARRLFPSTMSTFQPWSYRGTSISSSNSTTIGVSKFDVFDSDFSQGTATDWAGAHVQYYAGAALGVQRTWNNRYSGTLDLSTIWGTLRDPVYKTITSTVAMAGTNGGLSGGTFVLLLGSGAALTLPTAVGFSGVITLKNIHNADRTISTASAQTIDGASTLVLPPGSAVGVISDGSNWGVI